MEHQKLNRIIGFFVFVISLIIYGKTVAPTTSYWDCGEFITCSYILGVPHPPGAPLYILVGRVFTMIPDWLISDIGLRVNIISVLVSALSVMFTYLIIVRLIREFSGIQETVEQKVSVYVSAIIGALGFAVTDSQWFNAVEAEVYAVSMFFTAIVVWLILVWSEKAENPVSDKILLLIAYLIGLATGVHLLNILAIPTICLIVFFKRYQQESIWKFILFGVLSFVSLIILSFIVTPVVLGISRLFYDIDLSSASGFKETFQVLSTRYPAVINIATLWVLIASFVIHNYFNSKRQFWKEYSQVAVFVSILLLIFTAIYLGIVKGIPWVINESSFLILGLLVLALFGAIYYAIQNQQRILALSLMGFMLVSMGYSTYTALYIRSDMGPAINENHPNTPEKFVSYLNREQYGDIPVTERRAPMWEYQIKKMYIRYFGWQFIGKGTTLGPDNYIVETISTRGLMGLPFLVGLIGVFFHFNRDRKRAFSILTLFIATGFLITMYLNQEDPQPRERDYAYCGSFFAFSIWIGLGVMGTIELIRDFLNDKSLLRKLLYIFVPALIVLLIPRLIKLQPDGAFYKAFNGMGLFLALLGALIVVFSIIEWLFYYLKEKGIFKENYHVLSLLILFAIVPANLYKFNSRPHDRTGNYVAFDYSYNILQSCEPNAILFTNGDNDTFPLWYLQYVEGIRQDVRVVNLSLLNTPWYIKQLRDEEPKVPITLSDAQIDQLGATLWPEPRMAQIQVPRHKLLEQLEKQEDNASISAEDVPENPKIEFELSHTKIIANQPAILTQDRMIIHILAANRFEKPVYFSVTVSPTNMLNLDNRRNAEGLQNYLRMDGLAFRVMPYGGPRDFIAPAKLEANLFENFKYRNLDNQDVYFNNNILGLLQNYRSAFLRLANYFQSKGRTDKAFQEKSLAVLDQMDKVMPEEVIPLRDFRLSLNFGRMYSDFGRPEALEERLERIPEIYNLEPVDRLYLAEYYAQLLKNNAKAESLANALIEERPETREAYLWLASHYTRSKQLDKAAETLQTWLGTHPEDAAMQRQLIELQKFVGLTDSVETSKGSSDSSSLDHSDDNP